MSTSTKPAWCTQTSILRETFEQTMPPPLPFDLYFAATFFIKTGQPEIEVLSRLDLSPTDWNFYATTYGYLSETTLAQVRRAFSAYDEAELISRLIGPRWSFPDPQPTLAEAAGGIRKAVLSAPFLGPFRTLGWTAEHIINDPVAHLLFYSRDAETVYFDGKPLTDRRGAPLHLNAAAFRSLGGRFYTDGERILGQGEIGSARSKPFWWTLDSADPATFNALNQRYAKDAYRAWYITGKEIRTQSPEAFVIVPGLRLNYRAKQAEPLVQASHVARDRTKVYSYGTAIRNADPEYFRALGHNYWTDRRTVWKDEGKSILKGADAPTFLVPGPLEPPILNNHGAPATDRLQPWDLHGPVPVGDAIQVWRGFFEARPELTGWWWHKAASS